MNGFSSNVYFQYRDANGDRLRYYPDEDRWVALSDDPKELVKVSTYDSPDVA